MNQCPKKLSEEELNENAGKTVNFLKNNRFYFEKGEEEAKAFVTGFLNGYNPFTKLFTAFIIIIVVVFLFNLVLHFIFPGGGQDTIRSILLIILLYGGYFSLSFIEDFKEILTREINCKFTRAKIAEKYIFEETTKDFKEAIETNLNIDYKSKETIKEIIYFYERNYKDNLDAVESKLFFDDHFC